MNGDLVLLSGGIDSTCVAALRQPCSALFVDYGQKPARGERTAASAVASELGVPFHAIRVDCSEVGAGLLAGVRPHENAPSPEWWPFRNQLIGTLASAWAVTRGFDRVVMGTVVSDGERHRDGTGEFVVALDRVVSSQEGAINVIAPAIDLTTAELIAKANASNRLLSFTHSCHRSDVACGDCPGCKKRLAQLGLAGRLVTEVSDS